MTDRVRVRELTSCDGFALRVGEDVLVHLSARVPSWARAAAAQHLSDVVRSARRAYYATASLGLGDAICLLPIVVVRSYPVSRRPFAPGRRLVRGSMNVGVTAGR
jgi:hypothetical protein